jgi:hypothetical protein
LGPVPNNGATGGGAIAHTTNVDDEPLPRTPDGRDSLGHPELAVALVAGAMGVSGTAAAMAGPPLPVKRGGGQRDDGNVYQLWRKRGFSLRYGEPFCSGGIGWRCAVEVSPALAPRGREVTVSAASCLLCQ